MGVDLRVRNVRQAEIDDLSTVLHALHTKEDFVDQVINAGASNQTDYVVTIKRADLEELKKALRSILSVVEPTRVHIEPQD